MSESSRVLDLAAQPAAEDTTARFERADLVRGWQQFGGRTPVVVPEVRFGARTDMGQVRENNEDKFDFYEPDLPGVLATRGSLYAVADGMGGAQAGQIASEMMLKQVIAGYYDNPEPDAIGALAGAIAAANDRIYAVGQMIPERSGMGTTLVTIVLLEQRVIVAHVGDSRAYRVREGAIRQVTRDHSWVEEQVELGMMRREEAEQSPMRNVITRSIGARPEVEPEFLETDAAAGDLWVLCSDGLSGHVSEAEILAAACNHAPSEAARQLVDLANARGGRDNITVLIAAIRGLAPWSGSDLEVSAAKAADPAEGAPAAGDAASKPAPRASRWLRGLGR